MTVWKLHNLHFFVNAFLEFPVLYNQTGKASIKITSERNDEYNKNEEKNVFTSLFVV